MNFTRKQTLKNPKLASLLVEYPHILGQYLGYDELTELHSVWIKYLWMAPHHVSLQAHRGSFKTTSVLIVGFLWWILFHWDDRVCFIRKDFTSSSEVLKVISRIMNGPKFRSLFYSLYGTTFKLVTDTTDSLTWNLKTKESPEGNLSAFGIGGSLTGKHFDKIFGDDLITIRDRVSKAERDRVDNFVMELMANIIDPGKPVAFTGTPWHLRDTWRLLPRPIVFDIYSTNIARFTDEHIEQVKQITTPSLFAANYELKHIASEDTIFTAAKRTKNWDMTVPVFGHIDAKYQGDHTGAFTMMGKRPDGMIQAVGFIFRKHINEEYSNLMSKWVRYRSGTVSLELNADKGYAARDLGQLGMLTRGYNEKENKHVKIIQNLKTHWDRILWHEDTDPEYLSQILDYVEGQTPDDCPDSAASCIRENGIGSTGTTTTKFEEYEDEYRE
jgi:hypothetical protein